MRVPAQRPRVGFPGMPADQSTPQPWDPLLICTAGYILTSVARIQAIFPPLAAVRPALLFAAAGLLAYLFAGQRGPRALRAMRHPLAYLSLFVLFWATFSVPLALLPSRALAFLLDVLYKVGILFVLCAAAVRNLHDVRRLLLVYVIGAGVFAFFATAPGFRSVGAGGYDSNDSAMFLTSALPLCLYFVIGSKGLARWAFGGVLLTCLLAIVQSGSRGGFLAFLAVLIYVVFFFRGFKPTWRLGTVAGAIGVVLIAGTAEFWERMESLTEPDEDYNMHTVSGRRQVWTRGVGYVLANPLFGVGIDNFRVAEGRHPVIVERIRYGWGTQYKPAHSMWVDVAAELGIPGILAFAGLFVVAIRHLRREPMSLRGPPEADATTEDKIAMGQAIAGMLIALMVAGTFLSQSYGSMVWAALGLSLGFLKVRQQPLHGVAARFPFRPAHGRRGAGWRASVAAHPAVGRQLTADG